MKRRRNSISATRRKFTAATSISFALAMLMLFGIMAVTLYGAVLIKAKQDISTIEDMRGVMLPSSGVMNSDSLSGFLTGSKSVRYIYARFSQQTGEIEAIYSNMTDTYTYDDMAFVARAVASRGQDEGYYGKMSYRISRNGIFYTVTVVDITDSLLLIRSAVYIALIIMVLAFALFTALAYFFSKWALQPVEKAFNRQKRFISDASHELKTPLSVISASSDVLESEVGSNKWINNIREQTDAMNGLVHDLLDLAKLDETADEKVFRRFDLSNAVLKKSLEFESIAFEENKRFEQNITPGIFYTGSEPDIKRLTGILIDNAIKHSNVGGLISVSLTSEGSRCILKVFNTGSGLKKEDRERVFERFYRSDESRSKKTGGYGLGLSIAKSIVDMHSGKISADCEDDKWVCFTAVL